MTDAEAVRTTIPQAATALGGLDTVVICAGIIHIKPLSDVSEADWDATLAVNLKGAFLVCQAAAPSLKASGRGRVVALSSDAGLRGYPLIQAYTASKFGLIGLCQSLAVELAPEVTVNVVCPGACPTTGMGEMLVSLKMKSTGKTRDEVLASITQASPLGRYCHEADITSAVLHFISDDASFCTGVTLDVCGGELLGYIPGL